MHKLSSPIMITVTIVPAHVSKWILPTGSFFDITLLIVKTSFLGFFKAFNIIHNILIVFGQNKNPHQLFPT